MTVLSFVSLGYVWQLLGRGPFALPPQTLSDLKKSIFNYLLFTLYHFQWYLRITTFPGVWIEFSCMFPFPWKYIWNGTWVVSFFHLFSFSSYPVFSLFLLFGISELLFQWFLKKQFDVFLVPSVSDLIYLVRPLRAEYFNHFEQKDWCPQSVDILVLYIKINFLSLHCGTIMLQTKSDSNKKMNLWNKKQWWTSYDCHFFVEIFQQFWASRYLIESWIKLSD